MKPQDFIGQWTLSRKVYGRDRRTIGRMWGRVTYKEVADEALLYEECVWNRSGEASPLLARQTYLYLFKETALEIHREGKEQEIPFFRLPYGETVIDGHYACRPDFYKLRWVWVHPGFFYTRYVVTGTRKDYTLETVFRR